MEKGAASGELERSLRATRIFDKALKLFEGDVEGALRWLHTPQKALSAEAPLKASQTELGALEVKTLIGRIEHGVYS